MESSFSINVPTEYESCDGSRSTRNILYEFGIKNQNSSNYDDFRLQITDPSDPGFLFDYKMSAVEFTTIKNELSLRCDFLKFPESLNKLLIYCTQRDNWKSIINSKSEQTPIFYIEETTDINLVRPMKLNIIKASDARLNEYLTSEVIKFKSLYVENDKKLKELESHVIESTEQIQTKNQQLIQQYEEKVQSCESEKQKIINECESKLRLMKSQYTNEIRTSEEQHNKQLNEETEKLNEKISVLMQQVKQLETEKFGLIAKTERQTERIQNLEAQNEEMRKDILRKEEDGKQTTSSLMDTSKKEATLQLQNEHLKKENVSCKNQINLLSQQLATKEELAASLKETIANKMKEIQELQAIKAEHENLLKEHDFLKNKSRDVITKFTKQISEYKEELEQKDDDLDEAEQTIEDYKEKIYSINQMYTELRKQNSSLEFQIRNLNNEKEDLSKKLDASEIQVNALAKQIDQQAFALRPKLFSPQYSQISNSSTSVEIPQCTETQLPQSISYPSYLQKDVANGPFTKQNNEADDIEYEYEYEEEEEEENESQAKQDNPPAIDLMAAFRS